MEIIHFEKSQFMATPAQASYTLYFFYTYKMYGGEWCWLWDDDKLLLEDALKKYPKDKYDWEEIKED